MDGMIVGILIGFLVGTNLIFMYHIVKIHRQLEQWEKRLRTYNDELRSRVNND